MISKNINGKETFEVAEIQLIYKSKIKLSLRPQINNPHVAVSILRKYWDKDKIDFIEQFKVLLLNPAKKFVGMYEVSSGSTRGTTCEPKLVFVAALKANASGIIIAHNHPAGSLKPSVADIALTAEFQQWGKILQIPVLDHIILTSESYLSFGNEGLL
jgi:DNA repair protein RadC